MEVHNAGAQACRMQYSGNLQKKIFIEYHGKENVGAIFANLSSEKPCI